ncbi:hypothetical protein O0L34_g15429 [Tuta absoluta]|nr:hypothetical protein O0L34_g15429 [Tuta absoluta]
MADNLIVNEFLVFVQNKVDVLDELAIIQICASNYTEAEIEEGKNVLFDACPMCEIGRIKRKGDDKSKKNIKDVIKVIKETERTLLPTFVAKNLNRLPPVCFDYVDVSRLLKDILVLKTELQYLRQDTASKNEVEAIKTQFHSDLAELRSNVANTKASINKQNKTNKKSTGRKSSTPRKNISNDTIVQPLDFETDTSAHSLPPCADHERKLTYRDIVGKDRRASTKTGLKNQACGNNNKPQLPPPPPLQSSANKIDNDGFTIVMHKKPKKLVRKNIRGTQDSDTCKLKVCSPKYSMYLSRVNKCMSEQDILDHISSMGEDCDSVVLLQQHNEVDFRSFKITFDGSKVGKFLDRSFWPKGLVFRMYKERTKTANFNKS